MCFVRFSAGVRLVLAGWCGVYGGLQAGRAQVPLNAVDPLGSLVYTSAVWEGTIRRAGDHVLYELPLEDPQAVSVVVTAHQADLQPILEVFSPGSNPASSTALASVGPPAEGVALLQSFRVDYAEDAGVYTFRVRGAGASTGAFSIRFVLNAALEEEAWGGTRNHDPLQPFDIEAAQPLDRIDDPRRGNAFTRLSRIHPKFADRAAVLGELASPEDRDWYCFTLKNYYGATIALAALDGSEAEIELYRVVQDREGAAPRVEPVKRDFLVAHLDGGLEPENVADVIHMTPDEGRGGRYCVAVVGDPGPYQLLVTCNSLFDVKTYDPSYLQANPGEVLQARDAVPLYDSRVVLGALTHPQEQDAYIFEAEPNHVVRLVLDLPGQGALGFGNALHAAVVEVVAFPVREDIDSASGERVLRSDGAPRVVPLSAGPGAGVTTFLHSYGDVLFVATVGAVDQASAGEYVLSIDTGTPTKDEYLEEKGSAVWGDFLIPADALPGGARLGRFVGDVIESLTYAANKSAKEPEALRRIADASGNLRFAGKGKVMQSYLVPRTVERVAADTLIEPNTLKVLESVTRKQAGGGFLFNLKERKVVLIVSRTDGEPIRSGSLPYDVAFRDPYKDIDIVRVINMFTYEVKPRGSTKTFVLTAEELLDGDLYREIIGNRFPNRETFELPPANTRVVVDRVHKEFQIKLGRFTINRIPFEKALLDQELFPVAFPDDYSRMVVQVVEPVRKLMSIKKALRKQPVGWLEALARHEGNPTRLTFDVEKVGSEFRLKTFMNGDIIGERDVRFFVKEEWVQFTTIRFDAQRNKFFISTPELGEEVERLPAQVLKPEVHALFVRDADSPLRIERTLGEQDLVIALNDVPIVQRPVAEVFGSSVSEKLVLHTGFDRTFGHVVVVVKEPIQIIGETEDAVRGGLYQLFLALADAGDNVRLKFEVFDTGLNEGVFFKLDELELGLVGYLPSEPMLRYPYRGRVEHMRLLPDQQSSTVIGVFDGQRQSKTVPWAELFEPAFLDIFTADRVKVTMRIDRQMERIEVFANDARLQLIPYSKQAHDLGIEKIFTRDDIVPIRFGQRVDFVEVIRGYREEIRFVDVEEVFTPAFKEIIDSQPPGPVRVDWYGAMGDERVIAFYDENGNPIPGAVLAYDNAIKPAHLIDFMTELLEAQKSGKTTVSISPDRTQIVLQDSNHISHFPLLPEFTGFLQKVDKNKVLIRNHRLSPDGSKVIVTLEPGDDLTRTKAPTKRDALQPWDVSEGIGRRRRSRGVFGQVWDPWRWSRPREGALYGGWPAGRAFRVVHDLRTRTGVERRCQRVYDQIVCGHQRGLSRCVRGTRTWSKRRGSIRKYSTTSWPRSMSMKILQEAWSTCSGCSVPSIILPLTRSGFHQQR